MNFSFRNYPVIYGLLHARASATRRFEPSGARHRVLRETGGCARGDSLAPRLFLLGPSGAGIRCDFCQVPVSVLFCNSPLDLLTVSGLNARLTVYRNSGERR